MRPANDVSKARLAALLSLLGFALVPGTARASVMTPSSNLTTIQAPSWVGENFLLDQGLPSEVVFAEAQNVMLTSSLTVDLGGTIPTGTIVSSYFFALDAVQNTDVASSITFSTPVLGIIYIDGSANWALTNFLGAPGTTYDICQHCGFESKDSESFSGDTASFYNGFSEPGDFARIIVAGSPQSATPEPASFVLFGSALLGLGTIGWRRRKASC